jgi:quercetin dioxygenase-like cupin family protein
MKIYSTYREVKPAEEVPGVKMYVVAGPQEGAPNFIMRVFEVKPGTSTPLHNHPWEHEVYIISGNGKVRSATGETALAAGGVVYIAPDEKHCFTNTGGEPMRFVCVIPRRDKAATC